MAFATPADMRARVDFRWLRQLVLDDGTNASEATFDASDRVEAALEDGAGMILAYALQGQRYTAEDLDGLTGSGLGLLVRMNVDLAATLLAEVRQIPSEDIAKTIPGYGRTMQFLTQLQLGNVIFDVAKAARAGVPELAYNTQGTNVACHLARLVGDVSWTDQQNNGRFAQCRACGSSDCGGC